MIPHCGKECVMQLSSMEGPGTACIQDLPSLIQLWSLCFHETEADSAWFLSRRFVPEQTFVWRKDGNVCAVIYLIPVQAGAHRGGYLYAIGTHPDLQGLGIFGKLHQYVKEQAVAAGLHFLCLIPAAPSLFSLYGRLGYETWYGRQQISLTDMPQTVTPVSIRDCSSEDFLMHMEHHAATAPLLFYMSAADRQLVLQQFLHYEGFLKQCTVGHASFVLAGIQEDDILYLSQCNCSLNRLLPVGAALARAYSCNKLYLPPVRLQSAAPYAMGLWLTQDSAGLPAQSLGLMYT